jgi:hypothetical protein
MSRADRFFKRLLRLFPAEFRGEFRPIRSVVPGLDSIPMEANAAHVPVELWTREWKPFEELMMPADGAEITRGRIGFLASSQGAIVRAFGRASACLSTAWCSKARRPWTSRW